MTFLHVAFLGGALAVVVPIVLHLIMRQQPRHLEFPALRFIKKRELANRRQVKLRHWLLLALRCAIIGVLAMALARPSLVGSGVLGDQEAPVAAALVFDTNPRMGYRLQNKTRLEVAAETAQWLLPQLPPESDVAVVDSPTGSAVFAVDLGAAKQRIERLDAGAMSQPLSLAIESALKLVSESEKLRKEVYVFTDLSKAAWSPEATHALTRQMAELRDVGVYVIDVGVTDPANSGLADLRLSGQVLSRNSTLRVECDLVHVGPEGERSVALHLVNPQSGEADVRARESYALTPGETQRTDFRLRGLAHRLAPGISQALGRGCLGLR